MSLKVDDICDFVDQFYPQDSSNQEKFIYDINYKIMSAMYLRTALRNKMKDEFLIDYFIVYIEKEIDEKFDIELNESA